MSRHRATSVRPRYARLAALGSSLAVTAVAVLGSFGALPGTGAAEREPSSTAPAAAVGAADPGVDPGLGAAAVGGVGAAVGAAVEDPARVTALPAASGAGRRVVFSQSRQRVWLVAGDGRVERTYLVSGSVHDNLEPGTYQVYSRSQQAWGIDDSGTMRYFVRFAQGDRAAIGFHDIPVDDGEPIQTAAQLGTPQSHGCIRQRESDAIALWKFAPLGTTVVVTA